MTKQLSRSFRSTNRDAFRPRQAARRRYDHERGDAYDDDYEYEEAEIHHEDEEEETASEGPLAALTRRLKRSSLRHEPEPKLRRGRDFEDSPRARREPMVDPEEIAESAAALVTRRVAAGERHTAKALDNLAQLIEEGHQRRFDQDRLDEAVESLQRRAEASERKTARAIENIADMIEAGGRSAAQGEFDALAERLGRLEKKLAQSSPADDTRPIRTALARLESRMDRLSKDDRANEFTQALSGLDQRLSQIAARLDDDARARAAPPPPRRAQEENEASLPDPKAERAASRPPRPLAEAIADITRRQQALDDKPYAPRSPRQRQGDAALVETARSPRRFDDLRASMHALSRRLDTHGPHEDGALEPHAQIFAGHLENLRRQIESLAQIGHPDLAQRIDELRAGLEAQALQIERLRADLIQNPDQQLLIMRQIETLRRETEELARAEQNALEHSVDDLRASYEELARRIDGLRDDAAQRPDQQLLLMRQIEALQRKIDETANVEPPRIARRFGELDHALAELSRQLAEARAESQQNARQQGLALREMEALRQEVEGLARLMGDIAPRASVAAIETALCDLSHRIEAQRDRGVAEQALAPAERIASELRAALKELDPGPKLRHLESDVAAILRRLDQAKTGGGDAAALGALSRQTGEIKETLRLLASRPFPVETIETRLIDLSQRVEALSLNAPKAFTNLGELVKSIHAMVSTETSNGSAFNQRLELLAGKLDEALANSGAKRFDELSARIDDMHKSLAQRIEQGVAAHKPATSAALENLLATLAKKIDGALDVKAHNSAFEALGRKIEGLEDRFRDPGAAESFARIERLLARPENERQFAQLAQRLEELGRTLTTQFEQGNLAKGGVDIAQFEELARKLGDRIDAALAPGASRRDIEHLEQQIEHLSEKLDRLADSPQAAHLEELVARPAPQTQLNELSHRLDFMHEALAARIDAGARLRSEASEQQLAELVEGLARKMNGALAPSPDSSAVTALESHIKELSARLDHGAGAIPALASIEAKIAELFAGLEAAREEMTEAAEAALRKATLEVLREANGAVTRLNPTFKQELDELRRTQDESGVRTHETLSVVHETLERVVDRLAVFEEELTELRDAPPAQERGHEAASLSVALGGPAQAAPAVKLRIEPQLGAAPNGSRARTVEDDDLDAFKAAETTPHAEKAPTDFIAAARRAAQQAAAEADAQAQQDARRTAARNAARIAQGTASKSAGAPDDAAHMRKRPILLGLATLLVIGAAGGLYGAARFGLLSTRGAPPAAQSDAGQKAPARIIGDQGQQQNGAPAAPGEPVLAPQQISPPGPGEAAPSLGKGASGAQTDTTPTGSIDRPTALADETAAIKLAATRGDAAAQYEYAARLSEGRGGARDVKAAAVWFEKAAAQGLAPAQYRLGSIYEKGVGVDRDYAKARSWYQLAADNGNARAMHNLAVMFAEGNEGKPDYGAASDWFRRAAEFGVRDSQYNLAILYARGLGVGQSLIQSYMWFAAAAAQGDADAAKKRDEIGGRLDSKELAKAKELFEGFKPRQPKREANEVASPKGGWESLKAQTFKPDAKPFFMPSPSGRPKVSAM
jgi:localization factor PodJL